MKIRTLILGACLALASGAASAEVYKWTDESGKTHYGDRKPDNRDSERVNVRIGKPANPSKMAPDPRPEEPIPEEQTKAASNGLTDEQRRSNCEIAKNNLKTIKNNGRIRISEGQEQRYLTPEEIEDKRLEMQEIVATNCDPSSNF